jgi:hypothetical protein
MRVVRHPTLIFRDRTENASHYVRVARGRGRFFCDRVGIARTRRLSPRQGMPFKNMSQKMRVVRHPTLILRDHTENASHYVRVVRGRDRFFCDRKR